MPRKTFEAEVLDLIQSVGLFVRRVRAAAGAQDLSLSEMTALAHLDKHGPATTAELARAEGMKPQSMGTIVATLEEHGLVVRKPHPTDGRQVNIELSPKGAAFRSSIKDAKRTWVAQAIARLDERERETLFQAAEILKRLVEQ